MRFLLPEFLAPRTHRPLSVLNEASAQDLQALVEVFDSEDHARAACQRFYLGPSVVQLGDEALHLCQLCDHVQMAVRVAFGVKGACKLLEGVHVRSHWRRYKIKAARECCCLALNCIRCCINNISLDLIWQHPYFCLACLHLFNHYLWLHLI